MGEFVGYVGDPRLHDATIAAVDRVGDRLTVVAKDPDGLEIEVVFSDVSEVDEREAVGMIVYALAETRQPEGLRCFRFVNWDEPENSDARLAVVARNFSCRQLL